MYSSPNCKAKFATSFKFKNSLATSIQMFIFPYPRILLRSNNAHVILLLLCYTLNRRFCAEFKGRIVALLVEQKRWLLILKCDR
jgi:hypothetical protein